MALRISPSQQTKHPTNRWTCQSSEITTDLQARGTGYVHPSTCTLSPNSEPWHQFSFEFLRFQASEMEIIRRGHQTLSYLSRNLRSQFLCAWFHRRQCWGGQWPTLEIVLLHVLANRRIQVFLESCHLLAHFVIQKRFWSNRFRDQPSWFLRRVSTRPDKLRRIYRSTGRLGQVWCTRTPLFRPANRFNQCASWCPCHQ